MARRTTCRSPIQHSRVPRPVRADQLNNANIVFDHDTFAGIDVCSTCYEGRLEVTGGSAPSGVTIENSQFGPGGDADGIQDGANGVQIVGNTFVGIRQVDSVHTDSLQLYGQSNTLVANNYFHDFTSAIMGPDGGDHETIVNNVFDGDGSYPPAVQLGSQHSTQFVHNTLRNVDVYMDRKDESSDDSTNGVLRDNLLVNGTINTPAAKCDNCTVTNNMFSRASTAAGAGALVASPSFVGGANPTSWLGFALTAGSKGTHAATDHTDIGINTPNVAPPPPLPSTPPSTTSAASQRGTAKAKGIAINVSWHSTPRSPRTRQLTRLVAAIATHRAKGTRCRWRINRHTVRHGCNVRVRFRLAGRNRVTLRVTTASAGTATRSRAIVVRRRAHRH